MNRNRTMAAALFVAGAVGAGSLAAQEKSSAIQEIEKYRAALGDDNPAELWEARGEDLWKARRGPKNASLEACDLGLGPGVVKGAYTVLPKYFADSGKVEDLESRLVTCMVTLQGFTPEQAKKDPFGGPGKKVPMDALVAYITAQSRGMKMNVAGTHPKEIEAYELGRKIFFYHGGPHDFACETCHGADDKRIRLQDLPNLTKTSDVQKRLHHLARLSRLAGRGALDAVAAERLLPPAAIPAARVHVARVDRAHDVPREERQRRRDERARHQALGAAMKTKVIVASALLGVAAGCAHMSSYAPVEPTNEQVKAVLKGSFREMGQAKLDRLDQDEVQRLCSAAAGKALPKEEAERVEKSQLASIKYPADGYMGDWKAGEKIAQQGTGKQYSDDPTKPAGGNCYACHELTQEEIAFGTIGPSLRNFGKSRGFTPETQKYAYGKIYNSEAYAACSNMPRFGHMGILTEKQIKDVVALLMDPQSPVNK